MSTGNLLLLSHGNVTTVQRNHPDEFIGALRDVEAIHKRTGLPFTSDEQRRLAALAVLQSRGLFSESIAMPALTKPKRKSRKAKDKEAQPV